MSKTLQKIALSGIALIMLACTSQKNQPTESRGKQGQPDRPPSFEQLLDKMDANKDGMLSKSEVQGPLQREFVKIDLNEDGLITKEEFAKAPKPERGERPPRNNRK
ncbi:MAG: EF-hand domain-containing protein [Bacteroidia bacterium]|nr:EF-hand domain-containing protein [Bacteroidia bacterium]